MKIDNMHQQLGQMKSHDTLANPKIEEDKTAAQVTPIKSQPGTKVDISSASVEVSKAAKMMDKVPDERTQRIAELKSMIQNDTYEIDSTKIADKILGDPIADII